jgi:hypothetical protein
MRKRLLIAAVTIFWIVMMSLLWWTEFGRGKPVGAKVPPHVVWQKILTAPDSSTLEIRHGTNRIGYCRWRADVGQELATGMVMSDSAEPEGMVRNLTSYTLDIDGSVAIPDVPQRARFVFNITLDTNRVWQQFHLRVTLRPDVYEVSANATQNTVRVMVDAGADKFSRDIPFADFRDPRKLLLDVGGPALPLLLGVMGPLPSVNNNSNTVALPIRWEAHNDAMMLGKNPIRAYRLKGTLLDRYSATFYVSMVGEILRVDFPQKVSLVNDIITGLRRSE